MSKKQYALVIHPDGSEHRNIESKDSRFNLDELQNLVGGYIQMIKTNYFVDEEGLLKGLPYNTIGSRLVGTSIVGPLVIIKNNKFSEGS